MGKPMKRNESDRLDFPGDCGDLLVFSVIYSITIANELNNIEGTVFLFSYSLLKVKVPNLVLAIRLFFDLYIL